MPKGGNSGSRGKYISSFLESWYIDFQSVCISLCFNQQRRSISLDLHCLQHKLSLVSFLPSKSCDVPVWSSLGYNSLPFCEGLKDNTSPKEVTLLEGVTCWRLALRSHIYSSHTKWHQPLPIPAYHDVELSSSTVSTTYHHEVAL